MNLSIDNELLVRTIKNNRSFAIEAVYKETIKKTYRYIYFRVYDEEDAKDITEEVYIKLMKQFDHYDGEESISSWIYQIARTEIADFWREKYKAGDDFLKRLFVSQELMEENQQATTRVREILSKIPENYAQVLELRFLKGYNVEECAKELKISESNVKVLQHRALKKAGELTYE